MAAPSEDPAVSNRGPGGGPLVLVTGLPGTGKSAIADAAASMLSAPVLGHDWVMSGLRSFSEMQTALDAMNPPGHRAVGWSILFALARAQLRRGSSAVLDGVARMAEIAECRDLADEESVSLVVVVTDCSDLELHRSRVEGRRRGIPGWYEVDWDSVQRSRATWEPIEGSALMLDAIHPIQSNVDRLSALLGRTVKPEASPPVTVRSGDRGGSGADHHDG